MVDRSDRNEAVLEIGMLRIEDLEIVDTRLEEPSGLPEREPVFSLVGVIIPFELHLWRVSHWLCRSMAYHGARRPGASEPRAEADHTWIGHDASDRVRPRARRLDPEHETGLFSPGSIVRARAVRDDHPILWGYDEEFPAFDRFGPYLSVSADRESDVSCGTLPPTRSS
jgi:hypothetical protein